MRESYQWNLGVVGDDEPRKCALHVRPAVILSAVRHSFWDRRTRGNIGGGRTLRGDSCDLSALAGSGQF